MTKEAKKLLEEIKWQGNIRQLNNICLRLIVNCDDDVIGPDEIYEVLNQEEWPVKVPSELEVYPQIKQDHWKAAGSLEPEEAVRIKRMLEYYSNNRTKTAKALGISRSTLWRKIKQFHICEGKRL